MASYNARLEQVFSPGAKKLLENRGIEVSDLRKIYFGDKAVSLETLDNYMEMHSDVQFLLGIHEIAAIQAVENKWPTYFYKFSYDSGNSMVKANFGLDMPGNS